METEDCLDPEVEQERMETMERLVNLGSVPGVWPAAAPRRTG